MTAAPPARAQDRPAPIVEGTVGWAGFVDEAWIDRTAFGGSLRVFVSERLAIGPEYLFLQGDNDEFDWTLTANANFDLLRDEPGRRLTPYLAFGGGYLRQVARFGAESFSSGEGTVSGGGGVRIALGPRVFLAPEARIGYEPELRLVVTIGVRPGR